jgi:site-specific recombinase XerD
MNFFLHKFRHTFATNHLRDGVDIRTVQAWLGHRDIKSTMVYLKGIRSKDAAQKVNSGELAALVAWKTKGKSNYEGSPQMRLFSILRGKTATERPLKV